MRHIKKIKDYSIVCGMGAILVVGLVSCSQSPSEQRQSDQNAFSEASKKQGAFVVIEEVAPNKYKIVEEYPAKETRVILKTLDGKEKILSKEELDKLVQQEAKKIDEGRSALTNPELANANGGLSLGETILASAAGAVIGSWIGSKLFNNPAYQQQRRATFKNPSAYTRSVNSFNRARTSTATSRRSGFFRSSTPSVTRSITPRRSSGFFRRSGSSFRRFGG